MILRNFIIACAVTCLVPGMIADSQPQRQKPGTTAKAPVQPKLSKKNANTAVAQLRKVRDTLSASEKLSRQKLANAKTTARKTREAEQLLKDAGVAERSPEFRQAKARRLNAENSVSDLNIEHAEARRQKRAANRTLSAAKKGDWVSAHASVSSKNPVTPKPRLRKITFKEQPLGPTPNGNRKRSGFLSFFFGSSRR